MPDRHGMFREMLRIRMIEEEIVAHYSEGEMRCPTHICIGQEAPPIGISAHLRKDDAVFSAHRSHGHYIAKGGDVGAMMAELYGRKTGCASGKGGSQHLVDLDARFMGSAPILASTISVGVGMAWTMKRRDEDRVCVIYFGDGASAEVTALVAEHALSALKKPPVRVGLPPVLSPTTPELADHFYPRPIHIAETALKLCDSDRTVQEPDPVTPWRDVPDPTFTGPC